MVVFKKIKLKCYTSSSCCIYFQKIKSALDANQIPFPERCFAILNPVAPLEKNIFLNLFLFIQQQIYVYMYIFAF